MAAIATVNVSGGGNEAMVAAVLARLARVTPGEDPLVVPLGDDATAYVTDDEPGENDGYQVDIDVYSPEGRQATETAASHLYDLLVRSTAWGLRLLGAGAAPIAERPGLSHAS